MFRPHWVCPCSRGCVLSPSILLRLYTVGSVPCIAGGSSPWVCHKSADQVAPAFCAFPGLSSSGSQELDRCTLLRCGAPSPLRGPSLSFHPRQSGACALCLAATLPADVNHPESQEVFGQKLEACLQFGRGCRLWGPSLPLSPPPLPPASSRDGPVRRQLALLWTCSVPFFCERPAVCLGGLIFPLSLAIPQFKLLSHESSL